MVSASEYEAFVQRVWRDVSGIEYVEERPRIMVTPSNVDFSKLSCVSLSLSPRRQPFSALTLRKFRRYKKPAVQTLEVQNIGKVRIVDPWLEPRCAMC